MKTYVLFIVLTFGLFINVYSQLHNYHPKPSPEVAYKSNATESANSNSDSRVFDHFMSPPSLQKTLGDFWRNDSVISFDIIDNQDSIAISKTILHYNTLENTVEYVVTKRSDEQSEWKNANKYLLTFNDNNLQTQSIAYEWEDEQWLEQSKTDWSYDDNGRHVSYTAFNWDGEQWIGDRKTEREYNVKGEEIFQTSFLWNPDLNLWLNDYKVSFDYNEMGLLFRNIYFGTDMETNAWVYVHKDSTVYTDEGLEYLKFEFYWNKDNSVWDKYERITFSYHDGLRSHYRDYWVDSAWKYFYKSEEFRINSARIGDNGYRYMHDSIWVHKYKSEYEINSNGRLVFQESYRLPEDYTVWVGEIKFETTFNEMDQRLSRTSYNWDYWLDAWVPGEKKENVYNQEGFLSYNCVSYWYYEQWDKSESSVYYYTNTIITNSTSKIQDCLVFPNPVVQDLCVDIEETTDYPIAYKILNMAGTYCDSGLTRSGERIAVDHLPSGTYLLQCEAYGKYYLAKFLKR